MTRFLSFLSHLLILASSSAWVARIEGRARSYGGATQLCAQIESPNVEGLENHEVEGELMAESIAAWLDSEVRQQECRGPIVLATSSCVLALTSKTKQHVFVQ
jgi:hypothetical protein